VITFEALLGRAWHHAVRAATALASVPADEAGDNAALTAEADLPLAARSKAAFAAEESTLDSPSRRLPHATQACLVLVIEWLRCAASLAPDHASLIDAADRVATLEASTRGGVEGPAAMINSVLEREVKGRVARLMSTSQSR
jgi:hypothetical protein